MTPAATVKSDAPPEDPVRAALNTEDFRARMLVWARALLAQRMPYVSLAERTANAEDIVQEAATRALTKAAQFDPGKGVVNAWMYRILYYVVCEHYRQSRCQPAQSPDDDTLWEQLAVDWSAGTDEVVADRLDAAGCLERLAPEQREILEMRYRDDLDFATIGRRLGISAGYARVRLCRVQQELRKMHGTTTREGGR